MDLIRRVCQYCQTVDTSCELSCGFQFTSVWNHIYALPVLECLDGRRVKGWMTVAIRVPLPPSTPTLPNHTVTIDVSFLSFYLLQSVQTESNLFRVIS